jgi:hypothetical protein
MVRLRAAILGCGPRAIEHAQAYREVQRGQLSTNHGWWVQTEAEGLQGESVPYPAEDRRAQAELTDSVLASLGDPERHPAHAATARVSTDLVLAAQRSALLRRRINPAEPVVDEDISGLQAALGESR